MLAIFTLPNEIRVVGEAIQSSYTRYQKMGALCDRTSGDGSTLVCEWDTILMRSSIYQVTNDCGYFIPV